MSTLLSTARMAVVLGAISFLNDAAVAGLEEVENALSRAVRSPSAGSLSDAKEELRKSVPSLFTRVLSEGTPIHARISEGDKRKNFLQLRRGGLIFLPLFSGEEEKGIPWGTLSAEAGEIENLMIKPVLSTKLGSSGSVVMINLHLSLREEWGEATSSIVVNFALETTRALATCQVVLGETSLLEDAHRGMVNVVENYPGIRVEHVFEVYGVERAERVAQYCRELTEEND